MRIKPNVVIFDQSPSFKLMLAAVDAACYEVLGFEGTLTSCREGNHSLDSKHYWRKDRDAEAGDFRTWIKPWVPIQIGPEKRRRLAEAIENRIHAVPGGWKLFVHPTHMHVGRIGYEIL